MKVKIIRENTEPFGTEYSCMMMMVDGKLVFIRPGTKEFEAIQEVIRSSDDLAPRGVPKEATAEDFAFFFNQLRELGPMEKA